MYSSSFYDRMVVIGQPLRYFSPESAAHFSYFRQFGMEDYPMVTSPSNSTQSDSDNSVSSIEVPSHSIAIPGTKKDEKRQCLWKNCGVIFPSLADLASHVAQCHSSGGSDGLFHCGWDGCSRNDKGFNARYKMLVHVRTHTNEKPHRCFQCDKSFSRAENLKIHSRSHSGEKPYICPVPGCGKAYSNSSDRFKHTRTHSVEKPYQCKVPGCSKRYTDPSSLRKHVKTYKHYSVGDSMMPVKTTTEHGSTIEEEEGRDGKRSPSRTPDEELMIENHVPVITVNSMHPALEEDGDDFELRMKSGSFGFVQRYERNKDLYRPYELDRTRTPTTMDVDGPLDLSVRKEI